MNIFVTSQDPRQSAINLDSKRVVKMVLESAQLLSNAAHTHCPDLAPYRKTHINHPCSIWTSSHRANYIWLLEHFKHLCIEYTYRFNKIHACEKLIPAFEKVGSHIEDSKLHDQFVNCSLFKDESDIITAYRKTMIEKWLNDKRTPVWHNRNKPEWFIGETSRILPASN